MSAPSRKSTPLAVVYVRSDSNVCYISRLVSAPTRKSATLVVGLCPLRSEKSATPVSSRSSILLDFISGVFPMFPEIFEKDDDSNSHIDFITAASVSIFVTRCIMTLCKVDHNSSFRIF